MSTFTRLYFVNRGPGISDDDPSDLAYGPGDQVGSPEIAPLEALGDPDPDSGPGFGEPAPWRDVHVPLQPRSPLLDLWQAGQSASRRDSGPADDADLEF